MEQGRRDGGGAMNDGREELIDFHIVDQLRQLAAASSAPGLLDELLASFRETLDESLPELQRAVAARDLRRTDRVAHLIAGAAANIGLPLIRRAARALELAARNGEEANLDRLLEDVTRECTRGPAALARAIAT